jgi:hypothetical protein
MQKQQNPASRTPVQANAPGASRTVQTKAIRLVNVPRNRPLPKAFKNPALGNKNRVDSGYDEERVDQKPVQNEKPTRKVPGYLAPTKASAAKTTAKFAKPVVQPARTVDRKLNVR